MKIYNNPNLKSLVTFFYSSKCSTLPKLSYLSKELNMTLSELRTLLSVFENCNYIYKNGNGYTIFNTKRNFRQFTNVVDNGNHLIYSSPDYSITFNKTKLEILEPNFRIETIEDLIYMLFLFTIKFKVIIKPRIYTKNNEMWYKKECSLYKDNSVLFMCEFTQHSDTIDLINI